MKSNKVLVVIVIVLILINCTLLSFVWLNVYHVKRHPPIQGPAFDFLSRELQLTPAQKTQYEKLRNAHAYFADSVNTQTRMMRDSFFDRLKDPSVKPEIINTLEKKISDNTAKLDTSTFYHFRRFRAILTAAQQEKFDDVIQDVLHGMGGRPPQGGPSGGENMRPGPPQGGPPQNEPHGKGMRHPGGPPDGQGMGRHPFGPPQGGPPPPDEGRHGPGGGGPPPDGGRPGGPPPPNEGPPPNGGPPQN
jgi:hypothetical protein